MTSTPLPDRYPGARTLNEAQRLHAQHTLLVDALHGLILCPLPTTASNLRILDIGTADGYFLEQVRDEVLTDPTSAYLVGTDIKAYPSSTPEKGTIELRTHDLRTPFPEEWKDCFDLVQMRNCLGSTGTNEAAVNVIRRLLELVKPGTGWIQLVDGAMFAGPITDTDGPWSKLSKTIGNIMKNVGLDSSLGSRVATLLAMAGGDGIAEYESRSASSPIGKGCKPELKAVGYAQINGIVETAGGALERMESPPMTVEEFREVGEGCFGEAREVGVSMPWFAAWARRV